MTSWRAVGPSNWITTTSSSSAAPAFAPSATSVVTYAPNLTSVAANLDPYRPWNTVNLDGYLYIFNGYNQPKRWDGGASLYNLGAAAPANGTFTIADAAAGTTFALGAVVRYKLVWRNSTNGKESAPELAADGTPGSSHTMVANKDILITWTDPGGEWDKVGIYRALAGSDTFHFVADVTASAATYTDSNTDATIRLNEVYVERARLTLPPIFWAAWSHLNRFYAVLEDDTTLAYSQQALETGGRAHLLQEDFPPANLLPVAPEDGQGPIRGGFSIHDSFYVFKERGCYEITGDSPATFVVRRMYADRGALNPRCVTPIEDVVAILDHRGLYVWMPGGEPRIAAASPGTKDSTLEPIWRRMNLSAASTFHMVHDVRERRLKVYVALDYEPVPNVRIVYNYGTNLFESVDTGVWGGGAAYLEDSFGRLHECRGDDLGRLWEEDVTTIEGVTTGETSMTLTTASSTVLTDSGASIETGINGVLGAPFSRGTAGSDPVDLNRAYAVTSSSVTNYYYSPETPAAGETLWLGGVPVVAQTPKLTLDVGEPKDFVRTQVEYDSGHAGTVAVATARDDGSFTVLANVNMTTGVIATVHNDGDRCHTIAYRFSQVAGGVGFAIRGIRILVNVLGRLP